MAEYVMDYDGWAEGMPIGAYFKVRDAMHERKRERIVRCRDCKHYYEVENYHPQGNYDSRCCKYFDTYNDEVEPDGFCAWGE